MHVPKHFWADVVTTAYFLINRMPSSILNWVTPFQTLFPHKSLFPIKPRVFGCTCFVQDVHSHVSKLDPNSLKRIFLGYSRVQKGYRCYCRRYLVLLMSPFLRILIFLKTRSTLVRGRTMICLFILLLLFLR